MSDKKVPRSSSKGLIQSIKDAMAAKATPGDDRKDEMLPVGRGGQNRQQRLDARIDAAQGIHTRQTTDSNNGY